MYNSPCGIVLQSVALTVSAGRALHTSRRQSVSGSWLRGDVTAVRKEFMSKTDTDVSPPVR